MSYFPISRIERIRELRRILTDRWGRRLPNDEAGRKLLAIVIDHALLIEGDLAERMAVQLLPEASDAEIAFMIDRAGAGLMWGPRVLADELDLTEAERVRLAVTTICAVDMTAKQRKSLKNRRKRLEKLAAAERQGLDAGATAR